jgi:hypothetical protein
MHFFMFIRGLEFASRVRPLVAMRVDGQPADDEVLNVVVVQRADDGFDAADFHGLKSRN